MLRFMIVTVALLIVTACSPTKPSHQEQSKQPDETADTSADTPGTKTEKSPMQVLVFSRTAGFRHGSIEFGVKAIQSLGDAHDFTVVATEDPEAFRADNLNRFAAVIFLNTTGDVLNEQQQQAMTGFINAGNGFVGIHSAADTEYDWPWYGQLCGAYFVSHPHIQPARIIVEDNAHPSTNHLTSDWTRTDEWYNYKATPRPNVRVLLALDEASYTGGSMPDDHPIAWCHEFDGGRAFYTGLGHTDASYAEPQFLEHLLGAINWAASRPN